MKAKFFNLLLLVSIAFCSQLSAQNLSASNKKVAIHKKNKTQKVKSIDNTIKDETTLTDKNGRRYEIINKRKIYTDNQKVQSFIQVEEQKK